MECKHLPQLSQSFVSDLKAFVIVSKSFKGQHVSTTKSSSGRQTTVPVSFEAFFLHSEFLDLLGFVKVVCPDVQHAVSISTVYI